jgi:hypothetical protein
MRSPRGKPANPRTGTARFWCRFASSRRFRVSGFSAAKDAQGVMHLMLNNHPLFQIGPLD